jgi:hypothetical protein
MNNLKGTNTNTYRRSMEIYRRKQKKKRRS